MFRRRKREIPLLQRRHRADIIQEAMRLIGVANRAESDSLKSGDAESTDAHELSRTKAVLAAQQALTERIVMSQASDLTMREISTELIQPVIDRSVVGDVAQLALAHALHGAKKRLSLH
jgi:hypothetical protein